MNVLLSTESHRFWVVVFSLSLVSMHILVSFWISSVICWFFRSVLFSLHMYVLLTVFFFFPCSPTALWSEKNAWNDFNFFEFTKARYMAQDVIYPWEGTICTWEKSEIHCWGKMSYRQQLGLTGPLCHLKLVFPC